MASSRLRKTFHYPESEGEEDRHLEMDEQEQEDLIRDLRQKDEERNTLYKLSFTILSLLSAAAHIPFTLGLGLGSSFADGNSFFSLLSIISLLCTAYQIQYTPLPRPDRKGKRPMRDVERENEPLQRLRSLGVVNGLVCVFLVVMAYWVRSGGGVLGLGGGVMYLGPGVILLVSVIARRAMASVDIAELEALKYDYKGA